MSLLLGLRRVSQSFNTLIRHRSLAHRHFNTQSCSRRVLFYAVKGGSSHLPSGECFYSAKIHKDGALGPAIRLPPISIPFEKISGSTTAVLNDKISLRIGRKTRIYSPDTGDCDGAHDDPAVKYILAFDMKEEQFRKIPLPYDSDSFSGYLIQTCGHLAFIEDMWKKGWEGSSDDKLKLWILEDDKWVYKPIHYPLRFWFVYSSLLAFNYITGEMLLQFRDTTLFLYCNTKTGTFREVQVSGFPHGNGSKHDYFGFRVIDVKFG
ncbi:hypothetical protein FH972_009305 [Carpinus fangiana]|uniref:F-box associated beta-propeller type 3 domain-containing protein n=1 Tax=Carpinus fangiana TaxID=176857 RepID=A0A5N6R330_9ROSI|nr:hypothetical protein FH972_009305 [Carpinus fangiana]